ncbi:MAG TPA: hypothetical protein VFY38_01965 [Pseudonocardia sp.]|nr:hypothetical protein [Pseudonocardia sp.]
MSLVAPLPRPRSPIVDVAVVGAGVMGAATAVAAFTAAARGHGAEVRRPLAVTGIDVRGDDLALDRTAAEVRA